ncbi:MAG: UDP-N-acetylglucosamine 1-carboxyvinyltransferase [Synergistales bacterium]|nr:UDP-N-acetylglucosamine 1-carboxyvinyltransferase [Synergistales bacterium]
MSEKVTLQIQPSRLSGDVMVSGAKNSVLKLLAASLLTSDTVIIQNYPKGILDAQVHVGMLERLGKECEVKNDQIKIRETDRIENILTWENRSIRNTLLILGALVTRFGSGSVPFPGGCDIGKGKNGRPYDLHIMLLEKMGAKVWEEKDMLYAETKNRLRGTDIHLPIRSTGATENAIIAGTLAEGRTRIWNPHIRPEILDLVDFLNSMGSEITVYGQEHIEVQGKEHLCGTTHRVIPDNIEALTWLIGGAITQGEIEIHDFPYEHLEVPLAFLRESGVRMFRGQTSLVVRGSSCYPLEISTGPYPGINSDMQPILAVFGAKAKGVSKYIDLRFPGRYGYAEELKKMGLKFEIEGNMLKLYGGSKLRGATVRALDLRAGVALSLAGFIAEGETTITDAWQIVRGYENFAEKINSLGGNATWIE